MAANKKSGISNRKSAISNPKSAILRALVYVVGDNIDTDQIIPAQHLNLVPTIPAEYRKLGALALSGLPADYPPFIKSGAMQAEYGIIVAGRNFGCGSSREHAPWALEVNGITMVIAQSYARIFRQNMFNCGMLAIELSKKDIDALFGLPDPMNTLCDIDLNDKTLIFSWGKGKSSAFTFSLNEFDEALVKAGGWLELADARY